MSEQASATEPDADSGKIYLRVTLGIQLTLIAAGVVFVLRRDWENVFLTTMVVLLTLAPALLRKHYRIFIPPEFQLVAAVFVFLSLFLGSGFDLYYKYWWWDIVLHTGSGFLLGIVGFLAVFLLNRTNRIPAGMKPGFIGLFGVAFAVFLGVLWEIFEFIVDRIAPAVNMQSNETGVVDTMQDLIVDTLGAVIVALMGWAYLRTGRYSFIAEGIRGFLKRNPQLFEESGGK